MRVIGFQMSVFTRGCWSHVSLAEHVSDTRPVTSSRWQSLSTTYYVNVRWGTPKGARE